MERSLIWPILGHENIIDFLKKSVSHMTFHHAYLFLGSHGLGKSTIAREFINLLICERAENSDISCKTCNNCLQFEKNIYPDLYVVQRISDAKTGKLNKNIRIEQIKELQEKIQTHSFFGNYKICIIYDADAMNSSSSNALLKTLEEPPSNTVFILLAQRESNIPLTIRSRCQIVKFYPVSRKLIYRYLLDKGEERSHAQTLSQLSDGCPGLAITYHQHKEIYAEYQNEVRDFIAFLHEEIHERFLRVSRMMSFGNDFNELATYLQGILKTWKNIIRDIVFLKLHLNHLLKHEFAVSELTVIGKKYTVSQLIDYLQILEKAQEYISYNVHPKLTLENIAVQIQ